MKLNPAAFTGREKQMIPSYKSDLDFLLRDSIDDNFRGFSIHYQPQIDTRTGGLYGAEALARWRCGKYGEVSPADFIPILEENGKIVELGKWVFRKAAEQCRRWRRMLPDFRMSVNLSCRYLEQTDMSLFAQMTLARLGLPSESMILELTESWPMHNGQAKEKMVHDLQKTGMKLAMDDFGSGYSSLLSLQKFPFHLVKIDKDFVKSMTRNDEQASLVPSLTQLCHNIGRQVCLEGVETQEEFEAVRQLGIEVMQGFYFGHPVPPEEFERLYL